MIEQEILSAIAYAEQAAQRLAMTAQAAEIFVTHPDNSRDVTLVGVIVGIQNACGSYRDALGNFRKDLQRRIKEQLEREQAAAATPAPAIGTTPLVALLQKQQ